MILMFRIVSENKTDSLEKKNGVGKMIDRIIVRPKSEESSNALLFTEAYFGVAPVVAQSLGPHYQSARLPELVIEDLASEKEARDSSASLPSNLFGGPIIGTRIGQSIYTAERKARTFSKSRIRVPNPLFEVSLL